jgi:IclR family transcriptional regulator, pca regulon regulatory protein
MSSQISVPNKAATPNPAKFQTSWGSEFAAFEGNPDFVLSLARGLRIIESFEGHSEGLSVAEISRHTGLSRAAVRRVLITLELLGYVEAAGRVYRLRHRVLRLGLSYLSSSSLFSIAQSTVQTIGDEVDESSTLCVLDNDEVFCVAGVVRKRIMRPGFTTGGRLPAYCTALGRVLLAGLPENEFMDYVDRVERKPLTRKTIVARREFIEEVRRVRSAGFSVIDDELELGVRAIAVPVLSSQGRVVAALSIGTQSSRISVREMQSRFLPLLKEHARLVGQFAC